jgi:hypothetical protein
MEPEGSLPCLQEPTTSPYPDRDNTSPSYSFRIHINTYVSSEIFTFQLQPLLTAEFEKWL